MAQQFDRLEWTALAGIPFAVRRIQPSVDIHGLYRYDVELAMEVPASLADRALWKSRATLIFVTDGEESSVHGMVVDLEQIQRADLDRNSLRLAVVPRVWEMTQASAKGTFLNRTVPELVARKLKAAGFNEGEDFLFRLRRKHPPHARLVQHDRTDFGFLQELCKLTGLSLSFAHGEGRDVLVISDSEGA
ncbi:contractile injection system protein, VgrG/Pvc8 family [Sorangium sp. So ce590]|uniref:contractile injection system protein, VgrG/Pvc8 family n=1 Tax=unclassified Sorangium TaxID=2621164 RepID=UPI003F63F211